MIRLLEASDGLIQIAGIVGIMGDGFCLHSRRDLDGLGFGTDMANTQKKYKRDTFFCYGGISHLFETFGEPGLMRQGIYFWGEGR